MALFKKKTEKVAETKQEGAAVVSLAPKAGIAHVLTAPRITEKATDQTGNSVYVFNVSPAANKQQVKEAVQTLYKVTPVKIRMAQIAPKTVRHTRSGKTGSTKKAKKAYVYLKKGESIAIM